MQFATINLLQSSRSELAAQQQTSGDKSVRGLSKGETKKPVSFWSSPCLLPPWEKSHPEEGLWEEVAEGLVPLPGGGTMDGQKPPGGCDHPEKGGIEIAQISIISVWYHVQSSSC